MDHKRARLVLGLVECAVATRGVTPAYALEEQLREGERRYLTQVRTRMYVKPIWARTDWPSDLDALEELAKGPEGWPVSTVVQARGIAPGASNRWIVAAGPLPARTGDSAEELYGEEVLLVDEEVARALDAGHDRLENAKLGGMLVDAYPREAFEVLEARCFDGD